MRILALDTATQACSAALLTEQTSITRERLTERGHAEHLLGMVDAVLAQAGIRLAQVDALAFGRGPGAFTGVRLAASVAQGLAFAAHLPVVPISDLSAVAQRALKGQTLDHVLACQDARMQQVYWACFDCEADGLVRLIGAECVSAAEAVQLPERWHGRIGAAGQGLRAYPQLTTRPEWNFASVQDELLPRALEIAQLAWPAAMAGRTVVPEQALPIYVRDDVTRPSSQ